MKQLKTTCVVLAIAGAMAGCVTGEDAVGTETGELTGCREIKHFAYQLGGATYGWDVTTEEDTLRQFVDTWKFGAYIQTHVQYRVSPVWSDCPHPNEIVRLSRPGQTLIGSHNCLNNGLGWEEYHINPQLLLKPRTPFITTDCNP